MNGKKSKAIRYVASYVDKTSGRVNIYNLDNPSAKVNLKTTYKHTSRTKTVMVYNKTTDVTTPTPMDMITRRLSPVCIRYHIQRLKKHYKRTHIMIPYFS